MSGESYNGQKSGRDGCGKCAAEWERESRDVVVQLRCDAMWWHWWEADSEGSSSLDSEARSNCWWCFE